MQKKILILLSIFFTAILNLSAADGNATKVADKNLGMTKELLEKYPIKDHHSVLMFNCLNCHADQGDDPQKFKDPGERSCLACHKSKKYMAERLAYMDLLKANPHNSVHDGPNLYCDECHREHKESVNMCDECHEREVKQWMRKTP
ncbi:MAG: cytochrome c3 family protein [Campylobacter sp.]|nr:cytochrome c3 family protein [Campylobacter sp.]